MKSLPVNTKSGEMFGALGLLFRAHPWHGISPGEAAPAVVSAYIELVPSDTVKYEVDKVSGLLRVDRPQKYSNVCPCLYGFIPQTLSSSRVASRVIASAEKLRGDEDPIDICVLTDRAISHGDVLVEAIPIGGFRLIDGDEVDDKIVAVLAGDSSYEHIDDISDCPAGIVERLRHYFLTYKSPPGEARPSCRILDVYGQGEARAVITSGNEDYHARFAGIPDLIAASLQPFLR